MRVGLLDQQGNELNLQLSPQKTCKDVTDLVLSVTEINQEFVFENITEKPIPSLLRSLSAPVQMEYPYSREELFFLMIHDNDGFNRWNASQLLAIDVINELQESKSANVPVIIEDAFKGVLENALQDDTIDQAMVAHLLALPTEGFLIEQAEVADVDVIHFVRESLSNHLALELKDLFAQIYNKTNIDEPYKADASSIARRALKNLSLGYLVRTKDSECLETCYKQFNTASNMTDRAAALRQLVNSSCEQGKNLGAQALDTFYQQWQHEPLVVDQWLSLIHI